MTAKSDDLKLPADSNGDDEAGQNKGDMEIEKLDPEVVDKLPEAAKVLEKMGIIKGQFSWRGPLPPQVINKMSQNKADALVDDYIRHCQSKDLFQEKMIKVMSDDEKNGRWHTSFRLLSYVVVGIIIFVICLFTNNLNFFEKIIPLGMAAFGGAGIAIIKIKEKINKKEDEIDIE